MTLSISTAEMDEKSKELFNDEELSDSFAICRLSDELGNRAIYT